MGAGARPVVTDMPDVTELKQRHRAVWASGDYDQIAQGIQAVGERDKAKRVVEERRERAANPEIRSALASLLARIGSEP